MTTPEPVEKRKFFSDFVPFKYEYLKFKLISTLIFKESSLDELSTEMNGQQ